MPTYPVLKLGSTGSAVRILQMNLTGLALNYNGFSINGQLDTKTEDALKNFNDRFEVPTRDIANATTWKLLTGNVKAIQRLLISKGYTLGAANGIYDAATAKAVRKFQRDNGLEQSGIVDPRTRQKLFDPYPKDDFESRPTSTDISSLNPYVASLARKFLALTKEHGLDVRITTAFRSWDESDVLYAQGRTTPGEIVSNARGGDSYHNWGLAFDAAPYEGGKVSTDQKKFMEMGRLGQQVGLKWGGTFKDLKDYPHFQYNFGLNTWDLLNGVRPPQMRWAKRVSRSAN